MSATVFLVASAARRVPRGGRRRGGAAGAARVNLGLGIFSGNPGAGSILKKTKTGEWAGVYIST